MEGYGKEINLSTESLSINKETIRNRIMKSNIPEHKLRKLWKVKSLI